jgi:hypothetical protein
MRLVARAVLPLVLVAPVSAGATAVRPSLALTASPARVTLRGSAGATIRLRNAGRQRVVVDVRRAGFALDLRGRPRIVARRPRTADGWVATRPRSLTLEPRGAASLTVSARPPARARPGDHLALVLLTTRPRRRGDLAVRMRLGVVVDVRVPGRVVHKLVLRKLRLRRHGRTRSLELLVVNRGNVAEEVGPRRTSLTLRRRGRVIAKLHAEARELLPRTRGVVLFRYRGRAGGSVSARAVVAPAGGGATESRSFRLRL